MLYKSIDFPRVLLNNQTTTFELTQIMRLGSRAPSDTCYLPSQTRETSLVCYIAIVGTHAHASIDQSVRPDKSKTFKFSIDSTTNLTCTEARKVGCRRLQGYQNITAQQKDCLSHCGRHVFHCLLLFY